MELNQLAGRYQVWRNGIHPFLDLGRTHGATHARHQLEKLRTIDTDDILPYLRPISHIFLREIVLAAFEEDKDCTVDRYLCRVHYRRYGWIALEAHTSPSNQLYDFNELRSFATRSVAAGMHTAIFVHTGDEKGASFAHLNACDVLLLGGDELVKLLKDCIIPALPHSYGATQPQPEYRKSWSRLLRAQLLGS
ncbi:hypothetical protein [Uliginosibacterium gangwonense]|uniref:hypothetical protein n=1 Tax=Uliginosibacterium gangwonense TaxID=392736 RepID=UPI0003A362AE|nr:hypothetical protein [Uliginosibacterium gangwonense]